MSMEEEEGWCVNASRRTQANSPLSEFLQCLVPMHWLFFPSGLTVGLLMEHAEKPHSSHTEGTHWTRQDGRGGLLHPHGRVLPSAK